MTPWTVARQASLSFTVSWSLLKLLSTELVMPSNHLILSCPFLLLPSIFPSIKVFSNESVLHIRWPKYWSFSISPSNEFRTNIQDWIPLGLTGLISLQSKRLLKVFSRTTVWKHSAFFMVHLSYPYMTTGKTTTLTIQTLLAKWCLCFSIHYLGLSQLFFQGVSFNFMAAVTVHSDFACRTIN